MHFFFRLVFQRVVFSIVSLAAISVIIFTLVEFLPGDAATRVLGRDATPKNIEVWRKRFNLDRPPVTRYLLWARNFALGNWGASLVSVQPSSAGNPGGKTMRSVADMVLPRLGNTLILASCVMAISIPASLFLGIVTAVFRKRRFTVWLSGLVLFGVSMPDYVTGILMLLVFAVYLNWFPPLSLINNAESTLEIVKMLTLPSLTLAIAVTGIAVRMMQGSLLQILDSDYVRFATLKGLSWSRILFSHALPNALGPAIRVTVLSLVWLIGGVVYVEVIFTFPGLGMLLLNSLKLLDTPVILAGTMLLSGFLIYANLIADLLAAYLNPKLRTE